MRGGSREFGNACALSRHEHTTQQSTKAIERTRAMTTRTANGTVKARSGVCECVDCCCCCFRSSWDSHGQDVLSGHHPRRIAVVARWLTINNIIRPERAEKQAAWQRVKSKAMTEEARILTRCQTFTRKINCSDNSNIRGPSRNKFALVVFFQVFDKIIILCAS